MEPRDGDGGAAAPALPPGTECVGAYSGIAMAILPVRPADLGDAAGISRSGNNVVGPVGDGGSGWRRAAGFAVADAGAGGGNRGGRGPARQAFFTDQDDRRSDTARS